jgi:DMSO reductase anchor subunit
MCPACYINGLLFLIFGASGAAMANNPWIIAISIILTIAGFWWMWKAYKRNKGIGGWKKNLKTSLLFLFVFAAGYGTAAYQTHEYFEHKYAKHNHD